MMQRLRDWGFTQEWRQGKRGEYLVLLQAILIIGFLLLPVYRPSSWPINTPLLFYLRWGFLIGLEVAALLFIIKGLQDLGDNLTPLPYPKDNGQLVRSGVYSLVRHPLYSSLVFAGLGWAIFQLSLSHLIATVILLIFLDIKARREETWLTQKYPEYTDYQQRVKKLIPGLY